MQNNIITEETSSKISIDYSQVGEYLKILEKLEGLGLSTKTEYRLPLVDTIGKRHYEKTRSARY